MHVNDAQEAASPPLDLSENIETNKKHISFEGFIEIIIIALIVIGLIVFSVNDSLQQSLKGMFEFIIDTIKSKI